MDIKDLRIKTPTTVALGDVTYGTVVELGTGDEARESLFGGLWLVTTPGPTGKPLLVRLSDGAVQSGLGPSFRVRPVPFCHLVVEK